MTKQRGSGRRHVRSWVLVLALMSGLLVPALAGAAGAPASAGEGRIIGQVVDPAGVPLSNVAVTVTWMDPVTTQDYYGTRARTDAQGVYDVTGLDFGKRYLVGFDSDDPRWRREFYDNAYSNDAVRPVVLSQSRSVFRADAALAPTPTVSGRVTDRTGAPLSGMDVRWCPTDCIYGGGNRTTTDSAGFYNLQTDTFGDFALRVQDPDGIYATMWWDASAVEGDATRIDVVEGGTSDIDVSLPVSGSISGTIDAHDSPGERSARVGAYARTKDGHFVSVNGAETDDAGGYVIRGLAPGTYRVGVSESDYASEIFPDQDTPQQGDDVEVRSGVTTDGIDMTLDPLSVITGRVTTSRGGGPVAGVNVSLGLLQQSESTREDGTYELRVQPGEYVLHFTERNHYEQWWRGAATKQGAQKVVVARRSTAGGIDARLTAKSAIVGRLTDRDGRPLSKDVAAYRVGRLGFGAAGSGHSDVDGNYIIDGLEPGRYLVQGASNLLEAHHVGMYWPNELYQEDATEITVGYSKVVEGIDIAVPKAAWVSGEVFGREINDIVEVSAERREGNGWRRRWVSRAGGYDESYSLVGLPAGLYRIRFVHRTTSSSRTQFWRNAYREQDATLIRLRAGQRVTGVNARVDVVPRPLRVRNRPVIRGSVRVGNRLRAVRDLYDARRVSRDYEWRLGSRVIKREQGRTMRVTSGMLGRRIQVRVTARKASRIPVEARSRRSPKVRR
ncbi:hypothetical protein GCM10027020_38350 [Nocardioides salsibiostraticola]